MALRSAAVVTGRVTVEVFDAAGALVSRATTSNLVVSSGLNLLAQRLAGAGAPISHLAAGTGATAPAPADTELEAESLRVSATAVPAVGGTTVFRAAMPPGVGTGTISEVGLFTQAVGGVMFSRAAFPPITKSPTDTAVFSWAITMA